MAWGATQPLEAAARCDRDESTAGAACSGGSTPEGESADPSSNSSGSSGGAPGAAAATAAAQQTQQQAQQWKQQGAAGAVPGDILSMSHGLLTPG